MVQPGTAPHRLHPHHGKIILVISGMVALVLALIATFMIINPETTTRIDPVAAQAAQAPAVFTEPVLVQLVLDRAKAAFVAVNRVDYRQIAAATAAGAKLTTGVFHDDYARAMTGEPIKATIKNKQVVGCSVRAVGIRSLSGSQADVLIVASRTTTSASVPATSGARPEIIIADLTMTAVQGNWLLSAVRDVSSASLPTVAPPGAAPLADAIQAGTQSMANLLSYRRGGFEADLQRALSGLTPAFAHQKESELKSLQSALDSTKTDFAGAVSGVAVAAAGVDVVTLLVLTHTDLVDGKGVRTPSAATQYEIGLQRIDGRWLISSFSPLTPN